MIRTEIKRNDGDPLVGSLVLYKYDSPDFYYLCQETDDPFHGEVEICLGHFSRIMDALAAYSVFEPDAEVKN